MNDLTHAFLITQAAKWLQGQRCAVIITDMTHGHTEGISETADAIGWHGSRSLLVECKVSREDFLADRHKAFRRMPDRGMGVMRYYCAPAGMIRTEELPERWGLLEWSGTRLRLKVKPSGGFSPRNAPAEISLLISALRRIGHTAPVGVSVSCYTYATKCRATLGVSVPLVAEAVTALTAGTGPVPLPAD